jgi:hypothetical protein
MPELSRPRYDLYDPAQLGGVLREALNETKCRPKTVFLKTRRFFSRKSMQDNRYRIVREKDYGESELRPANTMNTWTNSVGRTAGVGAAGEVDRPDRSDRSSRSFFDHACRLDRRGRTDDALDLLYDSIDDRFRSALFEDVDALLSSIDPEHASIDVLLGVLTATLPAASLLPSRSELLKQVRGMLESAGEPSDQLLAGLER